jgi:hypothetical protein
MAYVSFNAANADRLRGSFSCVNGTAYVMIGYSSHTDENNLIEYRRTYVKISGSSAELVVYKSKSKIVYEYSLYSYDDKKLS